MPITQPRAVSKSQEERELKSLRAAQRFMDAHPEFTPCPENRDALLQWFTSTGNLPTEEISYERAFVALADQGRLKLDGPRKLTPAEIQAEALMTADEFEEHCRSTGRWPEPKRSLTKSERIDEYKQQKAAHAVAMMTAKEYEQYARSRGEWL